jgi:hypothetical protein
VLYRLSSPSQPVCSRDSLADGTLLSTRIVVAGHTWRLLHQHAVMAFLNSRQHQCNVNAGRILHPRPLLGGQDTVVWDARWLWSLCQSICAQRYAL